MLNLFEILIYGRGRHSIIESRKSQEISEKKKTENIIRKKHIFATASSLVETMQVTNYILTKYFH